MEASPAWLLRTDYLRIRAVSNLSRFILALKWQAGIQKQSKRLNEASSIATVLVVEYGYCENNISQIQPQSARSYQRKHLYNVTSIPQPGLYNRTYTSYAAAVVGGGSTVNGMFLNRGAADDYNNWEKLGNPGWGFEGILPYFIKVRNP